MLDLGYIHPEQFKLAKNAPLTANYFGLVSEVKAPYVAEEIRRYMIQEYGLRAYSEGLEVYTTINSKFQNSATNAVEKGLESYDRRHGFRKPENIANLFPVNFFDLSKREQLLDIEDILISDSIDSNEENELSLVFQSLEAYAQNQDRFLAVVINAEDFLRCLTKDGKILDVLWSDKLSWARPYINENRRGTKPRGFSDILTEGDIVWLKRDYVTKSISLTQIPEAQSALISLDPHDGSILSLVGGYDFFLSKFNRVEQASPLLGSNFKPFLYAAAFSEGFTPASLINDAPIIFEDNALEEKWKPRNASGKFYGPTRLREGLLQSRNLVSVRLLREIGVEKVRKYAERFGFDKQRLPSDLSLSLGTASHNPMTNAAAYAVFANGGKRIKPYMIERIIGRSGEVLYKNKKEEPKQVIDSRVAFLINDILKEAATRGTARKVSELNRKDFAGKTGTTNNAESTWFTGYNEEIVSSVWMGFDQPKSLGDREFGSSTALPIWMNYKKDIIDSIPVTNSLPPKGLSIVKIDKKSGKIANDQSKNPIFEYFLEENLPN
jgi:penicillin-binding protein 1A